MLADLDELRDAPDVERQVALIGPVEVRPAKYVPCAHTAPEPERRQVLRVLHRRQDETLDGAAP